MPEWTPDMKMGDEQHSAYTDAGVDLRKRDNSLKTLLGWLEESWKNRGHVALPFGHFANVVSLASGEIAISTDGVGTKSILAHVLDKYDTIGIDCVAMNANDILCVGAEPETLVDYIAVREMSPPMLYEIGKGLYYGAKEANITIVGGEIAQIPEILQSVDGEMPFDLVGTCVGSMIPGLPRTGIRISEGDSIIGLRSSGVHSNGLTLARKIFGVTQKRTKIEKKRILDRYYAELGCTLGEELLRPTKIYVTEVMNMIQAGVDIKGLAHITGDGLLNLPRLNNGVAYVIDNLPEPNLIFQLIQKQGAVSNAEMYEVFNMGIGFCVIAPEKDWEEAISIVEAHGGEASRIGYIAKTPLATVTITVMGLQGSRGNGFKGML